MTQPLSPHPVDLLHHGKWLLLPLMAIIVLTTGTWWIERGDDPVSMTIPAANAGETVTPNPPAVGAPTDTDMTINLAVVKPLAGPVVQRPEFVSLLEWQVLQEVAKQEADSDLVLTRLVNNLRFNKQLSLCQSWPARLPVGQRLLLAQQLLDEIPLHVQQQELSRQDGESLQQQLLALIVKDPQQRRRQLELEAAKLKVLLTPVPDGKTP